MDCKKCHHAVLTKEQPHIYCNGTCAEVYHATCVGLNKEQLAAVSPPYRNSFWLCDDCFTEFVQWRNEKKERNVSTANVQKSVGPKCVLHDDIIELKAKVDSIMSMLSSNGECNLDTVMKHSTPNQIVCSDPFTSGSSDQTALDDSARVSNSANDSFALLLTNIDSSVSEDDVQVMVSRCLGACDTECKSIRKLVPRWVDTSSLDYISFKIVLNRKWKSKAMMPSTWPRNVKSREFRQRQCTWKPDDR
ncbi:uncharacterized protein LOC134225853 [Armigeres subalbatus]|uniref:uncharacterized protein LOC134225853 n=1 Tax=Armigeres subalbatus TaxID=124917 RepID=UPI002ED36A32